ncbi:hypothetical protein BV25DRAFT_1834200 [Artomyces pyxidatus]|uniref:Uncharacterized protein n=1 Tax=Artomyces pyxidatus TaxID=48021 RepID=A0ACB8TLD4_9AGAM|nr:hypothetical protein BV25DRAFT_1834200 [Artomyces pyxidatus]
MTVFALRLADPNSTPSTGKQPPTSDNQRARLRAQKQLQNEELERKEEEAALAMTESQLKTLQSAFETVKVEFFDLDGLSWPQRDLDSTCEPLHVNTRLSRPGYPANLSVQLPSHPPTSRATSETIACTPTSPIAPSTPLPTSASVRDVVVSADDTIRVSRLRPARRPSAPQVFATELAGRRRRDSHGKGKAKVKRKVSADYKKASEATSPSSAGGPVPCMLPELSAGYLGEYKTEKRPSDPQAIGDRQVQARCRHWGQRSAACCIEPPPPSETILNTCYNGVIWR